MGNQICCADADTKEFQDVIDLDKGREKFYEVEKYCM
jgi:hypothetical protein